MTAVYPDGIYVPRTKENANGITYDAANTKRLYAEDVVKNDAEIVAVETELGTDCKGSFGSVRSRIEAVENGSFGVFLTYVDLCAATGIFELVPAQVGKFFLVLSIQCLDTVFDDLNFDADLACGFFEPDYNDVCTVDLPTVLGGTEKAYINSGITIPISTALKCNLSIVDTGTAGTCGIVVTGYYL